MATVSKKSGKKATSATQVGALELENKLLKQQIALLKAKKVTKTRQRHFWQSFFAGLAAVIAIAAFTLFNLSYWTQQIIIDNKQFTATVAPIIQNPDVQATLQTEITKRIFTRIDVEQELKTALPDNLQFIAAPFASQVESFTNKKIGEALQSPQIAQAWTTAVASIHSQLIAYIQDPNNNGVITIDDVYVKVGDQLKTSKIGFLFGKNLPSSIGSVTVAEVEWVPQARQAIDVLQKITNYLGLAALIAAIVALGLSRRRKSMIISLLGFSLFFLFVTLTLIHAGGLYATAQVADQYSAATKAIYGIVTETLVKQTQGFAMLWAAILAIMCVTSKLDLDWAVALRKKYRQGLDWCFSKLPHTMSPPSWLGWITQNYVVIGWTLTSVMFVVFALRLPPTLDGVIYALAGTVVTMFVLSCAAAYTRVYGRLNK